MGMRVKKKSIGHLLLLERLYVMSVHFQFRHMNEGRENEIKNFETDLDWKFIDIISMLEGGNDNFLLKMCCTDGKGRDASIVTPGPAVSYGDINGIYSSRASLRYRKMLRKKVLKVYNSGNAQQSKVLHLLESWWALSASQTCL